MITVYEPLNFSTRGRFFSRRRVCISPLPPSTPAGWQGRNKIIIISNAKKCKIMPFSLPSQPYRLPRQRD